MKKLALLPFLYICFSAAAQEKVYEQEQATVTTTNSVQKNIQTGRNIITISGKLFDHLAINSIDELLRYAAGIEVQQRGVQGAQSDILIRGGTFQQVLIVIDGIRWNDPLTGHFNGNIPIHPNEIERIEILKGPASAVWGSDAVGGVIHIITKAFSNKKKDSKNALVGFQFGQYQLSNFNFAAHKQTAKSYLSFGAFSNKADGQVLRGTTNKFKLYTLNANYAYHFNSGWNINFKSLLDYRDFNAQNFYTTFKSDTANEAVHSSFQHVQVSKQWDKHSFTSDLSFKSLRDEFQFNPSSIPNKNKTRQLIYQLNYQSTIADNTDFITGLQFTSKSIKSNDRGNHSVTNGATWFILKHVLKNNFYLNEGVRLDWNSNYGAVLTPQINLAYNPNKWSFRTSFAQGIRDADFTERYNNYNKTLVTGGSIGNPDLKTENTWNLELGADYVPNANLKIAATTFYRNQNNLVDWKPTAYSQMPRQVNLSPTGNYALASNLANVKTYGAELDVNYSKKINAQQAVIFNFNLTKLKSKNADSVPSFYISSHANWISNFNITYSYKNLTLALNGLYKARNTLAASAINATITSDYFVMHSKLSYTFYKNKIQVFGQVHNIFNKKYSDLLGSTMPERWITGGVHFNL
jgi:vitamin B12 transporter